MGLIMSDTTMVTAEHYPRRRDVHRAVTEPVDIQLRPIHVEALSHVTPQRGYVITSRDIAPPRADARPGSPGTPFVWLLAVSPATYAIGDFLFAVLLPRLYAPPLPLVILGIFVAAAVLFGLLDRATLSSRRLKAPSALWLLLTPIAYLIARAAGLADRRRSTWAPVAVWCASLLVPLVLGLVTAWIFVSTH